jgi:hypothetical protein
VVAYDVFLEDCPARTTLELVADTWSVIAVVALGRGPALYSEGHDPHSVFAWVGVGPTGEAFTRR